jgi:5-methylcytosine-specific restriction endonuclease McrA
MSRWFRFYDDVINDPKVLKLPDDLKWSWVALLCVASKRGGVLPSLAEVAFYLRLTESKAERVLVKLTEAGLLDRSDDIYVPHNWDKRQFVGDSSADRVKRHRAKREALGLTKQWSAPPSLREQVYDRDGHACVYCGAGNDLTIDHKIPEFRGGSNEIENLQTACRKCNASKRDLTHDEYVTRNGDVTLQKRPQSTEQITEQKKDAAPPGAQVVPIVTPEKIYFDQAHQSLGSGGRALAGRLLKAKAGNVLAAHSALLTALQKSEPREYLGAIIRGRDDPDDARKRGDAW